MKKAPTFILLLILVLGGCQTDDPVQDENTPIDQRRSPIVISTVAYGDTYIKVVYGQPYKRGRDIFGGLEPFGDVWRTGANEATEITLTRDVEMAGLRIEAGTYALFTIPHPDEWTVILNTELGQWGAFTYDPQYDYIRFPVEPQELDQIVEALTISFQAIEQEETQMSIAWDNTRIDIPVAFINED